VLEYGYLCFAESDTCKQVVQKSSECIAVYTYMDTGFDTGMICTDI